MKNYEIFYRQGKEEKKHLIIRKHSEVDAIKELFNLLGYVFITKIQERKI